jgi:hypothetical protein
MHKGHSIWIPGCGIGGAPAMYFKRISEADINGTAISITIYYMEIGRVPGKAAAEDRTAAIKIKVAFFILSSKIGRFSLLQQAK